MPGKYPEDNLSSLQHGESLKSRNTVVLDYMLSRYLITGSEHNGDVCLKIIKDYLLSQNLQ